MCCEPLFVLAIATRLTAEPTLSQTGLGFQAYVVSHTHSDFAWADSIAGCLDKNVAAVAKSVELAEKYPDFRFCMEHMLAVREYLRRNPDKLETVRKLMEEGRFEAGGLFTGPWELTSGAEGLVRQLYLGKLWVKKNLGVDALTVWNVDVAGHTAQMPQILSKAGIKGLVISAGSEGPNLLRWQARDGSSVLTWRTLWGYGAGATLGLRNQDLTQTLTNMPRFMAELTRNTEEYHLPKIAFIADGTDLQSPTELVVENIRLWNAQNRYPPVTYSSTAAAFAAVEKATIATASGEMPSPWDSVQSQGNECFMLDRQLDGRVLAAEKLAAFDSVVDPSFSYPSSSFDEVWYERLYTFDHNWGGSHGEESDHIKTEKIQTAARITDKILSASFQSITSKVRFKKPNPEAIPIVVFNPLSWDRKDVVTVEFPVPAKDTVSVTVLDHNGAAVRSQLLAGQEGSSTTKLVFSGEVPALGYATYYASWVMKPSQWPSPFIADLAGYVFENEFYRLRLSPETSGINSLVDKRTGQELVSTNGPAACNELVAFEDTDEDIGLHLTGKRWLAREHPSTIQLVENGPMRLVIEVSGKLLETATRRQQLILYADLPKLDLVTTLDWDGKTNVQLYQEFPLNVRQPVIRYAVPYGWEQYGQEMKYAAPWFSHDIRPVAEHRWRGVRGWVELANQDTSVTLASQCNYAAFKDPLTELNADFLIQPLLLRTVRSCGGNHFFYHQKGQHKFRFALQSQADPTHLGEELDSPLLAYVVTNAPASSPNLPECLSFATSENDNVHIAVVKKADDGNGLILRLVEMKERSRTTQARIKLFRPVRMAMLTNIIEQNEHDLATKQREINVTLTPAAIETVRVRF
jgi:alpha-mannosidase